MTFNPYALIALTAGVVAVTLAVLIWTRRPGRAIVHFVALMAVIALWSFASGMEMLAATLWLKYLFTIVVYAAISLVPACLLVFVLAYTGRERWLNRRTLALLGLHPLIVTLLVVTNPWHLLFWTEITLDPALHVAYYVAGPLFWLHAIYAYVLLLLAAGLLAVAFLRSPQLYRGQIRGVLLAQFFPWVANAIYIFDLTPLPLYVDLTPPAFTLTGLFIAWSLYRFQFMDLAPVAHNAIFSGLPDGVFVLDARRRIVAANPAAIDLLGRDSEQVIGQTTEVAFAEYASFVARYRDLSNVDEEITIERDGETRTFQVRLSPLKDRNGTLTGRMIVLHDISDLKRTHRELQEARDKADESARIKGEFLATVSHELRTPLNAILGYTGLLKMGAMGHLPHAIREPVDRIHDSGGYLLSMINDILDLSRIESGGTQITNRPMDLRALVSGWHQKMLILAQDKGLALDAVVASDFPQYIEGDSTQLTQVVLNLLSNAIKFTSTGRVTLSVRLADDGCWLLQVQDTGQGIPDDAQQYIFDQFRQVNGGDQAGERGTGLGLAIVQRLVEAMGGTVWVESQLDVGSTFFVRLPLRLPEAQPAPQ